MAVANKALRRWNSLESKEQTKIQVEYGYYLDTLPPTCSMETKIERFSQWLLKEKNIQFS